MIPQFQKLRNLVYQLQVDLPVSYSDLIDLLKAETWPHDQIGYGQSDLAKRYRLNNPANPVLSQILSDVSGAEFKQAIIDQLYTESVFPGMWGVAPEKISAITVVYSAL